MKRLFIHIGTGKTGTSSIQNFLFENRKSLAKSFSLFYPEYGLSQLNHFGETISAHYPIVAWVKERNTQKLEKLVKLINDSTCTTTVISCENFYHHLGAKEIEFLATVFKQFSIEIICYVRRQDLFMESAWKQQIKVGDMKLSFPVFFERHSKEEFLDKVHANYYRMLNFWANVFSIDKIQVRVFDKSEWINGDLLDDFLTGCGVDTEKSNQVLKKNIYTNTALPTELIGILQKTNALNLVPKEQQQVFVYYLKGLMTFNNSPLLSSADRLAIIKNYQSSNQSLFSEFCHKPEPDCFQMIEDEKENIQTELLEDVAIKSLVASWQKTNPKIPISKKSLLKRIGKAYNRYLKGGLLLSADKKSTEIKENNYWPEKSIGFADCKRLADDLIKQKEIDIRSYFPQLNSVLRGLNQIALAELEGELSKEKTVAECVFLKNGCYEITVQHCPRLSDILMRLFPLSLYFELFSRSFPETEGKVFIALGDEPKANLPILAFCSNKAFHTLIPDSYFTRANGYLEYRKTIEDNWIPWEKRMPIAYWRGSTTGNGKKSEWRSLPRFQLCQLAANSELIDAKIGALTLGFKDTEFAEEIKASSFFDKREEPEQGLNYKYLIDIDGFSNAYSGLFKRLLSGSAVLKVTSANGYKQWYYDKLIPWENYVPIKSDLSDLEKTIQYLIDNDEKAKSIGEEGRKLALSITSKLAAEETLVKLSQFLKPMSTTNNFDVTNKAQQSPFSVNLDAPVNAVETSNLFFYHRFPSIPSIKSPLLSSLPRSTVTVKNAFVSAVVLNPNKNTKGLLGAIYDEKGELIKKASYRGPGSLLPIDPVTINSTQINKALFISGSCVYMGWLLNGFGHLLIEACARFWVLNSIDIANSRFVFHPLPGFPDLKKAFEIEIVRVLLESFGISKEQIIFARQDLKCEELIIPTSLFFLNKVADPSHVAVYHQVRKHLLENTKQPDSINSTCSLPKRIYLSRRLLKKALGNRKATNEKLIEQLFISYGFEIVFPEQLSLQTQVQMFSQAEIIAGCDGSAMHMAVFLPENAKVIVLANRGIFKNQLIMSAFSHSETHFIDSRKNKSVAHIPGPWEADIELITEELDKILAK